jgi:hemerythrin
MLKWKDDYLLGIKIIDEQHKRLFEISDRAFRLVVEKNDKERNKKFFDILKELISYTDYHFEFEENYMKSKNYKHFEEHKKLHSEFKKLIGNYELDINDENISEITTKVAKLLVEWLINHIMVQDKLYIEQ